MSSIIVAVALVGIIAIICFLLVGINNKQKRKHMKQFLTRFSELGSKNDMNFSSQVILKNSAIGLDGIGRKLLMGEEKDEVAFFSTVIDLHDLVSCSVKKQYASISGGDLKKRKMDTYLEKITLQFNRRSSPPAEVIFFNHTDNQVNEIADLTQKAKHWEAIINKLLKTQLKEIA
jgi:hypothetical protein